MTVREVVIRKIEKNLFVSVQITEESNLYTDLGYDSLSFITLLQEIENTYFIIFNIAEMEMCLEVGYLIAAVENKLKETVYD